MSALLRTTAGQMREDAKPAAAVLLELLADTHEHCSVDPESIHFCPELAAAELAAAEYMGADCARELTNA